MGVIIMLVTNEDEKFGRSLMKMIQTIMTAILLLPPPFLSHPSSAPLARIMRADLISLRRRRGLLTLLLLLLSWESL